MTDTVPTRPSVFNGWRLAGWGAASALLLLPALAGQITEEVNWAFGDFMVFGVMLAVLGLSIEGVAHICSNWKMRGALMIGAGLIFILVWAELAVGLFD